MQDIFLKSTLTTPEITFKPIKGFLELKGASYPEYTEEFYDPLIKGIQEYIEQSLDFKKTTIALKLSYFNTATNTVLSNIFKLFEQLHKKQTHEVTVEWFYEEDDDDMKELGQYFKNYTTLKFDFLVWEDRDDDDEEFEFNLLDI